jgi:hypothetical protein
MPASDRRCPSAADQQGWGQWWGRGPWSCIGAAISLTEETRRPRQDSNLRFRLRRAALYPLSYGGQHGQEACIRIDDNCSDTAYPARRTTVAA